MSGSLELAYEIGRDIGDDVCRRTREAVCHEPGSKGGEAAEAALLPRVHERHGRTFVGEGRSCAREREAAAVAFAAPGDGPRRWRATARAARRPQRPKRGETRRAEATSRPT